MVPRTEMVKRLRIRQGPVTLFTPDEIKRMEEEKTGLVDIAEFLDINLVDPVYYEGASYLAPDKGGEKAYRLLCDAMKKTGRVAVARWAARGKQYLVLLRPLKNVIILQQLRYPDEVRALDEVPVGTAESKENELSSRSSSSIRSPLLPSNPRSTRTRMGDGATRPRSTGRSRVRRSRAPPNNRAPRSSTSWRP